MYIITQDELSHYGVKGMKWGVRKDRISKKARNASTYIKNVTGSRSSAAVKKYRRKNIDGMSDADLRKAVNRMNLERQYRDLTRADLMFGQRAAENALKYNKSYKSVRKIVTR